MASVSSLGVGSGIDLQGLVDGLVASERQLRLGGLSAREALATEKISGYGLLKSSVALFNDSLLSLGDISTFRARTATSSNQEAFTVSATEDSILGSFSVEVLQAGVAQSLSGASFVDVTNTAITSADVGIGGGTLTIQVGSDPSFAVEISPANSSLNAIASAINDAEGNTGITATVINTDGGPVLLVNASETGSDNVISISVDDVDNNDTDAIGLSQLTFDPLDLPGSNLTETTAAQDAQISINGQTVTSSSGQTFTDVVTGISITAIAETTEAGTITVAEDTTKAISAIDDFIESFNALIDSVSSLGQAGTEDGQGAGVLVGDSVLRTLTSQLRRTIFTAVDTTQPEGVQTLSNIGISIDNVGKLTLDTSKLSELVADNFDDVARLLAADGNPVAQNQQFQSTDFAAVSTVVGEGQLNITVGEDSFSVAISAANSSLQGIRDAINSATDNAGVTASIILESDGGGGTTASLILTADEAGADISVAVADNDGNNTDLSGLSQLASNNLTQLVSSEVDTSEGIILRLQSVIEGFLGGSGQQGIIDARTAGLNADIERVGDDRIREESRIEAFEARLIKQYAALDLLVANLQSSGNFLLSQLNSISQISNPSSDS